MAVNPKQAAAAVTKLQPLFNRILVRKHDPPKQTLGGIMLPEPKREIAKKGTVIAVGPGTKNQDGTLVPMILSPGDDVLLPDYGGTKVDYEGNQYLMFRESEILAKVYDDN